MSEKTIIPLINKEELETQSSGAACTGCGGGGGCCGGFGIKAGSEKDVVFRNIFLYVAMGLIMFTVAFLLTRLMTWISG